MSKYNVKLKVACIEKQLKIYEIAELADIEVTRFSKIIRGSLEVTKKEKQRLSKVLGKPQKDLF